MKEDKKNYPTLDSELDRLNRLYHYDILGMKPEAQFDDLTNLASRLLELPICQITLMDADWQDFISNVGVDMDGNDREMSFCQYTVVQNHVLEISDTREDSRFKDHPLVVNPPHLRYYIGAPLIDDNGLIIGTLCGYGMEVKYATDAEKEMLAGLAKTVIRLIRYRKMNADQKKYVDIFSLDRSLKCVISKNGYFQLVNPAFKKILGWSEEELLSNHIVKFIHRGDVKKLINEKKNFELSHEKSNFSCRLISKSGEEIWFDWSYLSDSESSVIIASGHNMTGLLRTQESLKTAVDELNIAASAKDKFLSDMSHEIRTPLASIKGYSELMAETNLDNDQQKYIKSIDIASNHLIDIVNDVLDVYKLKEGKLLLNKKPLNIKSLMNDIYLLFNENARSKGLKLNLLLDGEIPDKVLSDRTRLIQIFSNLVSNAIKFTSSGEVTIKVSNVSSNEQESSLKFEIIDTGIGIKKKALDAIFERFTQSDKTIASTYGGTGLGLSISQYLVELMDGELKLESQENVGTRFWFNLTFKNAEIHEPKSIEKRLIDLTNVKILLVEDNEHLQVLCQLHLEREKADLKIASNGHDAIQLARENSFDLILMDIQMPEMNGIMATKYLRDELKLSIPIIGFSASSDDEKLTECKEAGMNDFIHKPFSIKDLLSKIEMHLKHKSYSKEWNNAKNNLALYNDSELIDKFVSIYKKRVPDDIKDLEKSLADDNVSQLARKAHFLSSTFQTMHLDLGLKISSEIMEAEKLKDHQKVVTTSVELRNYLEETLFQIKNNEE